MAYARAVAGEQRGASSDAAGHRPRGHTGESPSELEIFAATERLLESMPQHELTVAKIIREAGIARGTFYFYFASKHDVLTGLLHRVTENLLVVMRPWSARPPGDPEGPIREAIAGAASVWQEHRAVLRACQEGWRSNDDLAVVWTGILQRFTDDLASSIARERALGLAPAGREAREVAAVLAWSSENLFYLAGRGLLPSTGSEADIVDGLVDVFLRLIYATAAPRS